MSITISQFTIEAYDEVLTLWKQCNGIGLSAADSKEYIKSYLERNPGMNFVARNDDTIVGAILCGHDGRRGYIHHLAVHPECRHQGVGRQLADKCLSALQAAGIHKCHIFIFNDNADGIEFWRSVGWTHRSDISVISKTIVPGTGGDS